MSRRRAVKVRRRRRAAAALVVALSALALALLGALDGATPRASGQGGDREVLAQTDGSVPARGVIMLGSSPREAPAETWGIGQVGSESRPNWAIVRYAEGAGWSLAPMLNGQGGALAGFAPDEGSPLTGQLTPGGAGALVGTVTETSEANGESRESSREVLLVRNPGGSFQEVAAVPETLLGPQQSLFSKTRAPLLAPLDEGEGRAGALVVPVRGGEAGAAENEVLHWDGRAWTGEEVQVPVRDAEGFRVLAIGASSPSNAWLLGQLPGGGVDLFRRHPGSEAVWKPVAPAPGGVAGEAISANGMPFTVQGTGSPPSAKAQLLTVTDDGVWIDGERRDAHALLTMFFRPAGEGQDSGQVQASWCNVPPGSTPCTHGLPDSLPTGPSRSIAWADSSAPFGQRVITGLLEDVSLRLEGESFTRVLALGAGSSSSASLGAAFSEPREGWLGGEELPVHLTLHPAANRLTPYPVPFRFALLAVAPQPGVPVGSLASEALAVGDNGEVARYQPGEGWQPESLLGAGGRRATPRLRAVAWPAPTRAYAVGEVGQMWMWRAETGLWEPDPAAPRNFRGDLLGVAFDPSNPGRGYAVGQQGVLLRYGKSWAQEALPPEVAGASFTSIAFAGSEAIVAYRVPHPQTSTATGTVPASYTAGLLVNDGSGWHVDQAAATALGPGGVPWAVAGLPDGGAALSGQNFSEPMVLERNGPGAPWQPTAAPYPGLSPPGSLALFREGGALRAIGSGAIPNTREIDFVQPAPAGLPENLIRPYPAASGYVLRQTATGWHDEENDRDERAITPGGYVHYDLPYVPDPTAAVLVDTTGSMGWAVGGEIETAGEGSLDTADISRYPADGVPPPGVGSAPVAAPGGEATFAIAGGAQCAAPCADRAGARVGPDVWLSSALSQAGQIQGVRAFMYLGPRLTTGETTKEATREVPYTREFQRYATLLGASPMQTLAVASATDLAGAAGECDFVEAFGDFPAAQWRSGEPCTAQPAYYAFDSAGAAGTVRVVVLDQANGVGATQLAWLAQQIGEADGRGEPAIVLGNADLGAQMAAGNPSASAVASIIVKARGGASAYFYDSPDRNIQLPLRVGANSIPSFGSGSLGYMLANNATRQDFIGHSGFLLAQVNVAAPNPQTRRWPVTVRLIPNIGELAMEGKDGVLLRRSQPALFTGLARRPRAGCRASGGATRCETSPYIPIPANCVGAACENGVFPEYSFSSSRPDIGDFVAPNVASPDPRAVLLGPNDKPIHDSASGLFCAYNAGKTVVTISAGGLSSSLAVTVQAGSVRRPCGTQPLNEVAAQQSSQLTPPVPAPAPAPAGPAPAGGTPPSIPLPSAPVVAPPASVPPAAAHPFTPFFVPPAPLTPLLAFVPVPVPTPARPTPPSGTSAVTSPVEAAEKEEEEEEATESASNQAVAYRAEDHQPAPEYLLGLIVLAALAGASIRRRPRRGSRNARLAAAPSSARMQRPASGPPRGKGPW